MGSIKLYLILSYFILSYPILSHHIVLYCIVLYRILSYQCLGLRSLREMLISILQNALLHLYWRAGSMDLFSFMAANHDLIQTHWKLNRTIQIKLTVCPQTKWHWFVNYSFLSLEFGILARSEHIRRSGVCAPTWLLLTVNHTICMPCFIIYFTIIRSIIYKMNIMLFWKKCKTNGWDQKLRKRFTGVKIKWKVR